jgi:hypothetical protein
MARYNQKQRLAMPATRTALNGGITGALMNRGQQVSAAVHAAKAAGTSRSVAAQSIPKFGPTTKRRRRRRPMGGSYPGLPGR